MKYKVIIPPTNEQGSYKTTAEDNQHQSARAMALQDYNTCRAHDGLPPVKRLPTGTQFVQIR